jgi:hypothetical protein
VTILAGGKLSGDFEGFGIGALSVHTNRTPTTAAQNLSVLRITEPVLAESKVGIIVTNGDPAGLSRNTLAGADFQYHNSHFGGGNAILQSDFYYQRSSSSTLGDDDAFGAAINYPTNRGAGNSLSGRWGRTSRPLWVS